MTIKSIEVWYMKPEVARDLMFAASIKGVDSLKKERPGLVPTKKEELSRTHVRLVAYSSDWSLEEVYTSMQGEVWSPNGEARPLLESLGLQHTSMSCGDIIVEDGVIHMVSGIGFTRLSEVEPGAYDSSYAP